MRNMRILLAIDGSPYSEEAVRAVAERPWPEGSIARVLSVVDKFAPPPSVAEVVLQSGGRAEVALENRVHAAEHLTRKSAESLVNVSAEPIVREGDPKSVIVDEAKRWSADLVVVGTSGWGGIKRLVLGSVSHAVAVHAPCSVELVRSKTLE
jgi:nucleotide-binding universal stress UspA family protein